MFEAYERGAVPTNMDDVEEFTFATAEMRFASVLDISEFTLILESLFSFMARVHSSVSVPMIVSYGFSIVYTIQWLFSSLLVSVEELWPRDSIATGVFHIAGILWQGSYLQESRLIISFAAMILFLIGIVVLVIRARLFMSSHMASQTEMVAVLIVYQYTLPMLLPQLLVGVPYAWTELVRGNIGISIPVAFLCPLLWALYVVMLLLFIIPKMVLEDTALQTWSPRSSLIATTTVSVSCLVATTVVEMTSPARCIFPIISAIMLGGTGYITFTYTIMTRRIPSIIFSCVGITSAVIALIQAVNLVRESIPLEVVVPVIPVVFLAAYVALKLIMTRRTVAVMCFCDECAADNTDVEELMNKEFVSKADFIRKVRIAIDMWHPYVVTWKFFDYALSRWKYDTELMMFFTRVLSFFPQMNTTMMWVANQMLKTPGTFVRASYLMQAQYLSNSRQMAINPAIKKQTDDVRARMEVLRTLMCRFWDNVLQKNTSHFWDDAKKVSHFMNEVDDRLQRMIDEYPNSSDILQLQYQFLSQAKRDYQRAKETEDKIRIVEKLGRQRADIAMSSALQVYPNLRPFMQEVVDFNQTQDMSALELRDDEETKSSSLNGVESGGSEAWSQLDYAVQELTRHSKLGRVWTPVIVLVVMSIFTIVLYYFFVDQFLCGFLSTKTTVMDFMSSISSLQAELCYLRLVASTRVLLNVGADHLEIDDSLMNLLAPNVYQVEGLIHRFISDELAIKDIIVKIKALVVEAMQMFEKMDHNNDKIDQIAQLTSVDSVYEDQTLYSVVYQILIDTETGLTYDTREGYFNSKECTRMDELIGLMTPVFDSISKLCQEYSIEKYESAFSWLDQMMLFTLISSLGFVTLPFIMHVFRLHIQAEAISESFSYFPNTEIRAIITRLSVTGAKVHEDASQVAQLSLGNSEDSMDYVRLTLSFLMSFLPLLCLCSAGYILARGFVDNAETMSLTIGTLYYPISFLYNGFDSLTRVYAYDIAAAGGGVATMFVDDDARDAAVEQALGYFVDASSGLSSGLTSLIGVTYFFYYGTNIPEFATDNWDKTKTSSLEMFLMNPYPQTADLMSVIGQTCSIDHRRGGMKFTHPDATFLAMWYWEANFSHEIQTVLYWDAIMYGMDTDTQTAQTQEHIILAVGIVCQTLACITFVFFLLARDREISSSLIFYHYVSPQVFTQNHNAMELLEHGKGSSNVAHRSFGNADQILTGIVQSIVVTDRDMIIMDYNPAFTEMARPAEDLRGKSLIDLIKRDEDDHSWPDFIQRVAECLAGRQAPQFSMLITASLLSGNVVHMLGSVICMTAHRASLEGEHEEIQQIAIMFDDCTESILRHQILIQERQEISAMLVNVIPEQILTRLEEGEERVSFVVPGVTIGHVQVKCASNAPDWDFKESTPFGFYTAVFDEFNALMEDFDFLCKVRTCFDVFTYAGGVFSEVRSERHAEQAVRFALKLISNLPAISKRIGRDVELLIGLSTGGPAAAGVMGTSRPAFQIIGPVMRGAAQMMETGSTNQVHITRNVYEMIYASGFTIQECSDVVGDGIQETYIVTPT